MKRVNKTLALLLAILLLLAPLAGAAEIVPDETEEMVLAEILSPEDEAEIDIPDEPVKEPEQLAKRAKKAPSVSTQVIPSAEGESFSDGNFKYEVTSESPKEVQILGPNGDITGGGLAIPKEVVYQSASYSVVEIYDNAFYGMQFNGGLDLGSVREIGAQAFRDTSFNGGLHLPASIKTLGATTFARAKFTAGLTFDPNISELALPENAFLGCDFTGDLTIPAGIVSVGNSAFTNATFSGSLTLPNSQIVLDDSSFCDVEFKGGLNLGTGITTIANSAFKGSKFSGNLVIPDNVTEIVQYAFENAEFTGGLTLPDTPVTLGERIFKNATFGGTLNLGSGVSEITNHLFEGASFGSGLTIPATVTKIGNRAFTRSKFTGGLTLPNMPIAIEGYVFSQAIFGGALKLGSGLTAIPVSAFSNCSFAGDLTIPANITSIGELAFSGCKVTGKLTLPTNLTSIGEYAFAGCSFTGGLTLPANLTSIGEHAFNTCTFAGGLTLPANLTSIGEYAFAGCSFTGSLLLPNKLQEIGAGAFYDTPFSGTLTLPASLAKVESIDSQQASITLFGSNASFSAITSNLTSLSGISSYAFATLFSVPLSCDSAYAQMHRNFGFTMINGQGPTPIPPLPTPIPTPTEEPTPTATEEVTPTPTPTPTNPPYDPEVMPPTPAPTATVAPETLPSIPPKVEVEVDVTQDEDGQADITLNEDKLSEIIEKAQEEAKDAEEVTVEITLPSDAKDAQSAQFTLSANEIEKLIAAGITTITVVADGFSFSFNPADLPSGGGSVTITARPAAAPAGKAKEVIGDRPVWNIAVSQASSKSMQRALVKGNIRFAVPYTPAKGEKTGELCIVRVEESGAYTIVPGSGYFDGHMVWQSTPDAVFGVARQPATVKYKDIDGHWAKKGIDFALSRELVSGNADGNFYPNKNITRDEANAAIAKLLGFKPSQISNASGALSRSTLASLIVNGFQRGGHTLPKTRADQAFSDTKVANILRVQQAGIMTARQNAEFQPAASTKRGEFCMILRRIAVLLADPAQTYGWSSSDAGHTQYVQENGLLFTSWRTIDGKTYYFSKYGNMRKFWQKIDGATYYFGNTGVMQAGRWKLIDGSWYYFRANGKLATNATIDGYEVGADGKRK